MVAKTVHEIIAEIDEELPATNGEYSRIKALIRKSDSILSKAALRCRTNKIVKAYHELQYQYPIVFSNIC